MVRDIEKVGQAPPGTPRSDDDPEEPLILIGKEHFPIGRASETNAESGADLRITCAFATSILRLRLHVWPSPES